MTFLVTLLHVGFVLFILLCRHDLLQFCIVGLHRLHHLLPAILTLTLWRFRTLPPHIALWRFRALSSHAMRSVVTMMWWTHLVGIRRVQFQQFLGLLVIQLPQFGIRKLSKNLVI